MNFNLNTGIAAAELAMQATDPWDFSIEVDGVVYPTRPLLTFELGVLKQIGDKSPAEQRQFFGGLFSGNAPVNDWDDDRLQGAAIAIVTYFGERAKKKSLALQRQVRDAIRAAAAN